MERKSNVEHKSNVPLYVVSLLGLAIFTATTYVVVDQAGGVGVHPDDSNTPNFIVPGPPDFK
jgi:hypothetical protein